MKMYNMAKKQTIFNRFYFMRKKKRGSHTYNDYAIIQSAHLQRLHDRPRIDSMKNW